MSWRLPRWAKRSPVASDPDRPTEEQADGVDGRDAAQVPSEHDLPPVAPNVPPVVVPRWIQLVVLPVALLGLWALARAAGPVLLILIVASLVALILNPVVELIEHRGLRRGFAIPLTYVACFAVLGGVIALLATPISNQVSRFSSDVPHLVNQANNDLDQFQMWLNSHGIHIHIEKQGQTALQTLQKDVLKRSGDIVSFSRDVLGKIVTISFDLVLVLVLSVYLLVYGRQIGHLVRRLMPPGDGTAQDDFPLLIQRAVSGYVRGQVTFSFIMGMSAGVALWIFSLLGIFSQGGRYAIFFGAFYGLMEFIPYVGPIIGPVPAIVIALFNSPITGLWVVVLFIALQQLEGHLIAPQVFRISLRINPILIILSLLIGYQLYGIAGALVALPAAAVIRQTVIYLRAHLVLEPWGVIAPTAGVIPLGPDRCPDCGTAAGPDDAFCRSCGASLEPKVVAKDH